MSETLVTFALCSAMFPRPRFVLAPAAVFAPVPPDVIATTPLKVKLPEAVIGPPVKVNPVVPPFASTLVTVPAPATADQIKLDPFQLRKVEAVFGAVMNDVAFAPGW